MAMMIVETGAANDLLLNGDKVTTDKLAVVAEDVAIIAAGANWMVGELERRMGELMDDGPDLE
jgi:hypothetical protein